MSEAGSSTFLKKSKSAASAAKNSQYSRPAVLEVFCGAFFQKGDRLLAFTESHHVLAPKGGAE
jgi:hypothetical protein